eukprot:CAMPEP_0116832898 /NCGR_PEP_ID=MMETSP0418-20121206/6140_1 /TAXON_ID=1158023 /ORGANISM="Astrosyne radiata, Strain 13vi08-1A" /LENGTH=119 /DNA_ID=CAMNT_0004462295 /DNA_START=457 /DNA_END=817 /DNA_ORIENTATION=+
MAIVCLSKELALKTREFTMLKGTLNVLDPAISTWWCKANPLIHAPNHSSWSAHQNHHGTDSGIFREGLTGPTHDSHVLFGTALSTGTTVRDRITLLVASLADENTMMMNNQGAYLWTLV